MRVFSCGAFRWIHERNDCDANALAADVDVSSFIAQKQKQKKEKRFGLYSFVRTGIHHKVEWLLVNLSLPMVIVYLGKQKCKVHQCVERV